MSSRSAKGDLAKGTSFLRSVLWTGRYLRPEEIAALLSVETSGVYDAVRTGKLPCLRVGRHIRFTRGMLEKWLIRR